MNNCIDVLINLFIEIGEISLVSFLVQNHRSKPSPSTLYRVFQFHLNNMEPSEAHMTMEALRDSDRRSPVLFSMQKDLDRFQLVSQIRAAGLPTLEELQQLSGLEFEKLVAKNFEALGFSVQQTPPTGDFGADLLIVTPLGSRIVVQCKRYKSAVNLKAVQEVSAAVKHYNSDIGIVVTTSRFLKSAVELAKSTDIELWDQESLLCFFSKDISFSTLHEI